MQYIFSIPFSVKCSKKLMCIYLMKYSIVIALQVFYVVDDFRAVAAGPADPALAGPIFSL